MVALKIVWVVSAVSLVLLILLHSPKGDGLGGFGGQAQMFASTRSAETALNRFTWGLTVLFLGLTVVLSLGILTPIPSQSTPVPATSEQTIPSTPTVPTTLPVPSAPVPSAPVPSPAVPQPSPEVTPEPTPAN